MLPQAFRAATAGASWRRRRSRRVATRWPRQARTTLPLLVLLGDVRPSAAAVGPCSRPSRADPMIGFASARLTGADDGSIARLDFAGDRAIDELPRRLLAEIPDTYLVADAPGRCLLVKPVVGAEFRRARRAVSQCRRRAVALHEPRPPLRVPDGDLQSRRGRRAVVRRDPVRRPRSPPGTCRRPIACCFASCRPTSRRRSSSSARRTPPSPKRGSPARSLTRTAPVRRCCWTAGTSSPA